MASRRWSPERFLRSYGKHFECRGNSLFWAISPTNSIPVGTEVGHLRTLKRTGKSYRHAIIMGINYPVHQIVYVLYHGVWAEPEIDHINGNSLDNHIDNLRPATRSQNSRNHRKNRRNTSGVTGVSWMKTHNKWRCWITVERRHMHIGLFEKFEDAVAARKEAERREGYHELHGSDKPQVPQSDEGPTAVGVGPADRVRE